MHIQRQLLFNKTKTKIASALPKALLVTLVTLPLGSAWAMHRHLDYATNAPNCRGPLDLRNSIKRLGDERKLAGTNISQLYSCQAYVGDYSERERPKTIDTRWCVGIGTTAERDFFYALRAHKVERSGRRDWRLDRFWFYSRDYDRILAGLMGKSGFHAEIQRKKASLRATFRHSSDGWGFPERYVFEIDHKTKQLRFDFEYQGYHYLRQKSLDRSRPGSCRLVWSEAQSD